MATYTFKVEEPNQHLRLDVFLTQNLPDVASRSFVQHLIEAGQVTVNQKKVKSHYLVLTNDKVFVDYPEDELSLDNIPAENIPLDVFYEDEDLLVINKPAGMLVHPVPGCYTGTLVNAILHYCQNLSDFNSPVRPGIVHRLDRETSGLIVVAKNNTTHARLSRQFQKRRVKKKYLALVEGVIEFNEGLIDAPLAQHARYRDKKAVAFDDAAKKSKTVYRVIKRFKNSTFVALYPETGRTHQLRVHMAYLGHRILGDDKYGDKKAFSRLALHAQSIGFIHPIKNVYFEFSSKPPVEFIDYVTKSVLKV